MEDWLKDSFGHAIFPNLGDFIVGFVFVRGAIFTTAETGSTYKQVADDLADRVDEFLLGCEWATDEDRNFVAKDIRGDW